MNKKEFVRFLVKMFKTENGKISDLEYSSNKQFDIIIMYFPKIYNISIEILFIYEQYKVKK